jgi:anionic cell wall polymer biosynthesis LytR-Cps2A-Psr (LCP) family protein
LTRWAGYGIDVNRRIPIGSVGSQPTGYIEPEQDKLLDGETALWFVRSRLQSDDYDRMDRQKCVMNAMLRQLDAQTVLTRFEAIADAGKGLVKTNLPSAETSTMVALALKAQNLEALSVSFTPPLVNPSDPDFDVIRQKVQEAIARSEDADAGINLAELGGGSASVDLESICSAS